MTNNKLVPVNLGGYAQRISPRRPKVTALDLQERRSYGEFLLRFEKLFLVLGLFIVQSNILRSIGAVQDEMPAVPGSKTVSFAPPESTPLYVNGTMLLIYSVGLFFFLRRRCLNETLRVSPTLVILLLFPLVSIYWSISPIDTLKRAIMFTGASATGCYIGARYDLRELLKLFGAAAALNALVNLGGIMTIPDFASDAVNGWPGAWKGLYSNKNGLAHAGAFSFVVLVFCLPGDSFTTRAWAIFGSLASLALVLGSRSGTGLIAIAAVVGTMVWARSHQLVPRLNVVLTFVVLVLAAVFLGVFGFSDLFASTAEMMGKNSELTGRLPLWNLVYESVQRRPWLGYGYEAFWSPPPPDVKRIAQVLHYLPFYSHSGTLEVLLTGGYALGILVVVCAGTLLVRTLMLVRWPGAGWAECFPIVFFVLFMLANITESWWLRTSMPWMLFCAVFVCVSRIVASPRLNEQLDLSPGLMRGGAGRTKNRAARSEQGADS